MAMYHGERHHMGLLASRIMTLEEFLAEEDEVARDDEKCSKKPIPILLKSGETVGEYEEAFERRLKRRNVDPRMVHHDAVVERRFRMDFAESRAWELRRLHATLAGPAAIAIEGDPVAISPSSDSYHRVHDGLEYRGIRSRRELLETKVMTATEFMADVEKYGPNGPMFTGAKLKPIAVVLRPCESFVSFEANLERWLAKKRISLTQLRHDPEEERRYRQCFAYSRALEYIHILNEQGHVQQCKGHSSQQPVIGCVASRSWSSSREITCNNENDRWGAKRNASQESTCFEESFHEKRPRLDLQLQSPQTLAPDIDTKLQAHSSPLEKKVMNCVDQHTRDVVCRLEELLQEVKRLRAGVEDASSDCFVSKSAEVSKHADHTVKYELPVESSPNADIVRVAEEIIAKSNTVKADPIMEKLADKYKHFSDSVAVSERAMMINNVRQYKAVDILEAISAMMKEKQRRDEVLADLVTYQWRGCRRELARFLRQPSQVQDPIEAHERLALLYAKLEQSVKKVVTLRPKLMNRVNWLKKRDTDDIAEMRQFSNQLEIWLSANATLRKQCQSLGMDLVLRNAKLRGLVKILIENND